MLAGQCFNNPSCLVQFALYSTPNPSQQYLVTDVFQQFELFYGAQQYSKTQCPIQLTKYASFDNVLPFKMTTIFLIQETMSHPACSLLERNLPFDRIWMLLTTFDWNHYPDNLMARRESDSHDSQRHDTIIITIFKKTRRGPICGHRPVSERKASETRGGSRRRPVLLPHKPNCPQPWRNSVTHCSPDMLPTL